MGFSVCGVCTLRDEVVICGDIFGSGAYTGTTALVDNIRCDVAVT